MLDNKELDKLIADAIKDKIEDIDLSDEEIENEWKKLKARRKNRTPKYKKIIAIAAAIIIATIIIPLTTGQVYSWKIFKVFDISIQNGKVIISDVSSTNETTPEVEPGERESTLEDARKIMKFDFKELPFELKDITILNREKITLNYATTKGTINFTQKLKGLESSNILSIVESSNIHPFIKNGIEYNYINIKDKIIKIIWSSNGIYSSLEIKYYIDIDKAKKLIDLIK